MKTSIVGRLLALTLVVFVVVSCNLLDRLKTREGNGNSATSNTNSAPAEPGHVFTSPEGRFTVTLPPGYPMPEQRGSGMYQSLLPDRGMCVVLYRDLPPNAARGITAREFLERAHRQMPQRLSGDVEAIEEITVQGYPGISILAARNEMGGRFNLILAGSRLYEVAFAGPRKEERDTPEVRAFFDSFRITQTAPSPTPGRRAR